MAYELYPSLPIVVIRPYIVSQIYASPICGEVVKLVVWIVPFRQCQHMQVEFFYQCDHRSRVRQPRLFEVPRIRDVSEYAIGPTNHTGSDRLIHGFLLNKHDTIAHFPNTSPQETVSSASRGPTLVRFEGRGWNSMHRAGYYTPGARPHTFLSPS